MVQIVGRYQFVSSENFEEYLNAFGQVEDVKSLQKSTPVVEISQNGDQWVVTVENNGKSASSTFKLGEPYEEHFPSLSTPLKSVTRKEGDKFVTESQVGDFKGTRLYEFSDTGMVVHLSEAKQGVKATRTYKRI